MESSQKDVTDCVEIYICGGGGEVNIFAWHLTYVIDVLRCQTH